MQPINTIDGRWQAGVIPTVTDLRGTAFTEESGAHTFRVTAYDADGDAQTLTGAVTACFLRADDKTIAIDGTITDGVAVVTLDADCYHVAGRFSLAVYVSDGTDTACIYAAVGNVFRATSEVMLDSGTEIPSLAQLQEAYESCVDAPADAQALVDNWSVATVAETTTYLGIA